jgi:hypothetical protein
MGDISKGQKHRRFRKLQIKTQILVDQREQTLQLQVAKEEPLELD